MLRQLNQNEIELINDDPVRPHLPADWRLRSGREVWVYERNAGTVDAVICVAFTDEVPISESDLKWPGMDVAVFYTVWSYSKGAGREIIIEAGKRIKKKHPYVKRMVTLSPLTEMAEKFHIRNGAKFVRKGTNCQNFEYEMV
jgi:hypothetical protein